jgi:hypothetical protein
MEQKTGLLVKFLITQPGQPDLFSGHVEAWVLPFTTLFGVILLDPFREGYLESALDCKDYHEQNKKQIDLDDRKFSKCLVSTSQATSRQHGCLVSTEVHLSPEFQQL